MSRITDFESNWRKQKQKEEAEKAASKVSIVDSFSPEKYNEMKKNGQVVFDTDVVNNYFSNGSNYIDDAKNNISNPSYNWAKTFSNAETYGNIKKDSDYVRVYIESLKGTDKYDNLKKKYDEYNRVLSYYNNAAKQANEFASQFANENEYNNALREAKYANYSYDDLQKELNNFDNKSEDYKWLSGKSDEAASSKEIQEEYDSLTSEWNNLYDSIDIKSEKFNPNANQDTVRERMAEIEKRKESLPQLIENKKSEEKKKVEYDDVVNNNVKVKTLLQMYYDIQHMDKPEQITDTYSQANGNMTAPKYSDEDVQRINALYQSYKDNGFDMDTLYKYYSRDLVKHSDGYVSWSPKQAFEEAYSKIGDKPLVDTAILMKSDDYKERFIAEYQQLVIRYNGLKNMLIKWDRNELPFTPTCPRSTYNMQIKEMADYIAVLEARAVMENIDLQEE